MAVENTYSLIFSCVKVYLFYLHEYVGSDIPICLLNQQTHIHKANLFDTPHYPTCFGRLENEKHPDRVLAAPRILLKICLNNSTKLAFGTALSDNRNHFVPRLEEAAAGSG